MFLVELNAEIAVHAIGLDKRPNMVSRKAQRLARLYAYDNGTGKALIVTKCLIPCQVQAKS